MAISDLIWLAAGLLGLVVVIVAPRVAWRLLISQKQHARRRKQLILAARRGEPPPASPGPPNLWRVQYRFAMIGAALGLAGALIAVIVFVVGGH